MDESTAATEPAEKIEEEHEHVKEELKRVTKQETKEVQAEKAPTKIWFPL